MTSNDLLIYLQNWYASQCDGDWEHEYNGIKVVTLSNPAWSIEIDLRGTKIINKTMELIDIERNEDDWVICKIEDKYFKGYGGPHNLIELLTIFKDWATS